MKRTILLTIAAAVATVPAILGVTGNTTFSQSIPAAIPSGASVVPSVDDKGRDSDATTTPTASATATATTDDRGRGSDDGATASAARSATSAKSTVDDRGTGTEAGDDSGGHGGRSGGSRSGKG